MKKPNFEAFCKHIFKDFPELSSLDGFDIQDLGVEHGLLLKTKYDPAVHGECEYGSEKGDDWYVTNFNFPTAKDT